MAAVVPRLMRALEGTEDALILCDLEGTALLETTRARAWMELEGIGRRVRAEVGRVVGRLRAMSRRAAEDSVPLYRTPRIRRSVETSEGAVDLHGVVTGSGIFGHQPTIVIRLVQVDPVDVDLHRRARRWGLTDRQAEVAVLLAERRTNREISISLGISPHTARNHTQRVLAKLGIRSRREVAEKLSGERHVRPVA